MGQKFAKYGPATASLIASKIFAALGPDIAVAVAGTAVRPEWLAGLIAMEDPALYKWPDPRSTRFESGVFAKLKAVRSRLKVWVRGYNGITPDHLRGLSDEALRNLATSWGYTQIMGYYVLTLFKGRSLAELRDPKKHLVFAVTMMRATAQVWITSGRFDQIAHIWNAGSAYKVVKGVPQYRTYSPYYVYNCLAVADAYRKVLEVERAKAAPLPVAVQTEALKAAATQAQNTADRPLNAVEDSPTVDPDTVVSGSTTPTSTEGAVSAMREQNLGLVDPDSQYAEGIAGDLIQSPDFAAQLGQPTTAAIKPGWQTSEGQLTALFAIVAMVLAAIGFKSATPDKIQNVYELAMQSLSTLGPIVAAGGVLWNYITSRGKTKSNSIWATAAIQNPMVENSGLAQNGLAMGLGNFGGLLSGKNWKDPDRYIGLAKIVGGIAGGRTGSIIGSVTGGGATGLPSGFVEEVEQAFTVVAKRLDDVEARQREYDVNQILRPGDGVAGGRQQ